MFEIIIFILFGWLFFKVIGLMFKVAWGVTKLVAVILAVLALPALIIGLLFAGGVVLILPILLIAGAVGLLKCCA